MNGISPDALLEAMETGEPYPIKAMFMMQNNAIACMGAQPQRILPALQKMEFNVVVDLFLTPTALACADVLLPAACFAERIGITGHQPYALGAIAQAVEPLGECKSDQRIIYEAGRPLRRPRPSALGFRAGFLRLPAAQHRVHLRLAQGARVGLPRIRVPEVREGACCDPTARPASPRPPAATTSTAPRWPTSASRRLADVRGAAREPGIGARPGREVPARAHHGRPHHGAFFHSEHRQSPSMRRLHPEPEFMRDHPETADSLRHRRRRLGAPSANNLGSRTPTRTMPPCASAKTRCRPTTAGGSPSAGPEDGTLFGTHREQHQPARAHAAGQVGARRVVQVAAVPHR